VSGENLDLDSAAAKSDGIDCYLLRLVETGKEKGKSADKIARDIDADFTTHQRLSIHPTL
jgi:hypothetical protein